MTIARDISPVVFRGEPDNRLRELGDSQRPWFFTEAYSQAKLYAGNQKWPDPKDEPVACVLTGRTVLDLTVPDRADARHRAIIDALTMEFDDWTCRRSGEPRDPWSFIEAGDLYDYEGTGSGERWNALFRIAFEQADAVRVLDLTDGTSGQPVPVWVTHQRDAIRMATLGEELGARLEQQPWESIEAWLEGHHPQAGVLERADRMRRPDHDHRADRVHRVVPPRNFDAMGINGAPQPVYRGVPAAYEILPGDWIALNARYASEHGGRGQAAFVKRLPLVHPEDIFWAGTDESEFLYLPAAWRREDVSREEYLRSLTTDQLRMFCDGEMASLTRYAREIRAVEDHVHNAFDAEVCGLYHGPDHSARVSQHALAVSRSLGIDPLVPYIFGLVHDSQRLDDGADPEHGPRAAAFVRERRADLFGFLPDDALEALAMACDLHSEGQTQGDAWVRACFDADRLDLGRVDIVPDPDYLCTEYARRPEVIAAALAMSGQGGEDFIEEDDLEGRLQRFGA
ncbi:MULTISPECIES: hypothetical protein [unclassified Variovorax]|uniref:hypothetical protein n=1 Tax=unclassified Variovorax TaxID=663243 RepID=UPI00076C1CC0|nr:MULTISPECIES: hypothetical protein [unclassified Variovorax]KWT69521.1 hypothetical protein APY03_6881 [Variovorax sp. WDL1]PNG48836.1 hypothetical protein CHC06_06604 [Variovorax sp. B2]PNG49343.1 hypothetical protein CHC07_06252 [Variovorax sp. B4]VTV18367.1 hypothetical protein WDL1P2_00072 [Variovorax sp. WDL1]